MIVNSTLYDNPNITQLQLKAEIVDLNILHIGQIPTFLNAYFRKYKIVSFSADSTLEENDIDIILVNNDCNNSNNLLKSISNIKLTVAYTKAFYIKSGTDFIHSSLVPILLKYLLIIKESVGFITVKRDRNSSNSFLIKVKAIIDANMDDHALNMKKVSALMYMSRSSFSKKIKSYTGLKPTEYINHYKLEKSKHLLVVTNWQISKISDALGFCSQQYYCRLFKNQEGMNPSKYRIEYQNTIV